MSVAVALDQLREQLDDFGRRPFLVTVGGDGRAHVVSVLAGLDGDVLVVAAAGRTTRANVAANPSVTLLWPPVGVGPYALLVDGTVDAGADAGTDAGVTVTPTRAVLHRVADADVDLPGCVRLDAD